LSLVPLPESSTICEQYRTSSHCERNNYPTLHERLADSASSTWSATQPHSIASTSQYHRPLRLITWRRLVFAECAPSALTPSLASTGLRVL
jgi:hypothetical protein